MKISETGIYRSLNIKNSKVLGNDAVLTESVKCGNPVLIGAIRKLLICAYKTNPSELIKMESGEIEILEKNTYQEIVTCLICQCYMHLHSLKTK